jgi:hypothetical protein
MPTLCSNKQVSSTPNTMTDQKVVYPGFTNRSNANNCFSVLGGNRPSTRAALARHRAREMKPTILNAHPNPTSMINLFASMGQTTPPMDDPLVTIPSAKPRRLRNLCLKHDVQPCSTANQLHLTVFCWHVDVLSRVGDLFRASRS